MLAPTPLDTRALRRQFDRRAARFEQADFLLREVESRTLERLDVVKLQAADILDVGCGLGAGAAALSARWPEARVTAIDQSPAMVARAAGRVGERAGFLDQLKRVFGAAPARGVRLCAADAHALPFADAGFDLVWSNLALHWFADPLRAIGEWRRVLRPQGLLMFSCLGVDSLAGLRALGVPTMRFHDMHDLGDALIHAGFAEPVMDMEKLVLTWASPERLLQDLHLLGGDARTGRPEHLASRAARSRALAALESLRPAPGQPLELELELVHGHAWAPRPRVAPPGWEPVKILPRAPR